MKNQCQAKQVPFESSSSFDKALFILIYLGQLIWEMINLLFYFINLWSMINRKNKIETLFRTLVFENKDHLALE
jgi:hypothetical protein